MRARAPKITHKMTNSTTHAIITSCCYLSLLITTALFVQQPAWADDGTASPRLPSIWENAVSGSYHVLYQLEMSNSDSVLTIEEWASYNRRLFRLDLIGANGRTTYLTNGATREVFRYKPFVCDQIDEHARDMGTIAQLFMGYQWDQSETRRAPANTSGVPDKQQQQQQPQPPSVSAYGLGPLWLRASQDAARVDYSNVAANSGLTTEHDEFEVTMKEGLVKDQIPYKVRFYFKKGQPRPFVDFVDWVSVSPAGQHGDFSGNDGGGGSNDETEQIEARAKVLQADYRNQVDESVFDLPVGYGCKRRADLEVALDIEVGLTLLHEGAPNQATFEVITSRPVASTRSGLDQAGARAPSASSWLSQRYSMRMMRLSKGRMDSVDKTESYYASLMQFRDTTSSGGSSGGGPRIRRIKRVWWAPDSKRGQATVYTIDQSSGECQVDHQDVRDQIPLGFGSTAIPLLSPLEAKVNRGPKGEGVAPATTKTTTTDAEEGQEEEEEEQLGGPMVLSVEQIVFLFEDNQDYHLINLGETHGAELTSKRFRNRVYERRLHQFTLALGEGDITWQGPVSIVKQISTYSHLLDSSSQVGADLGGGGAAADNKLKLTSDYRTRLTIFFYSEDLSRVMYKAVIELLDNHEVSLEYAHQQLDVSSCFGRDDKQVVVVKYPLESAELSRELQEKEGALRGQVFVRLYTHLSSSFSSLQIYSIEPSFDVFNMRVEMSILDMPLTHTFQLERGQRLAVDEPARREAADAGDHAPGLIATTSSTADACANHCEHYNCLRFAFDITSRSCQIELIRSRVKTINSKTSELYTYLERRETKALLSSLAPQAQAQAQNDTAPTSSGGEDAGSRAHFSADSIIEYLDELVDAALQWEDEPGATGATASHHPENPLVLKLDLTPDLYYINNNEDKKDKAHKMITLWPSALEHSLENMQEYSRELEESAVTGSGGSSCAQEVIRVSGGHSIRLQYNVLLEDRVFEGVVGEQLDGVTYEECERHCETSDCRSFSYCLRDETCRISWQHNEKFIRSTSKAAPHPWQCSIYALDQLSKFEPYGRALPPMKAVSSEIAASPSDCANACMDLQGTAKCQGFYFCRMAAPQHKAAYKTNSKCYLIDWHANSLLQHERSNLLNPAHLAPSGATGSSDPRECEFYSRSFLAQFDKYLGRRLDLEQSQEMGVTIKAGHDLEFCAKQCINMNCLAFDACPDHAADASQAPLRLQDSSRARQTNCHLAVKSIRANQLTRERMCTTFVLSDKSHFNSQHAKLIFAPNSNGQPATVALRPDKEAEIGHNTDTKPETTTLTDDINGKELELLENYGKMSDQDAQGGASMPQETVASHWFAKLCSLMLGVLLGFGFILGWNEAYARGWLAQARSRLGR